MIFSLEKRSFPQGSVTRYLAHLFVIIFVALSATSVAQALDRHKLIASYLYNFAKNIEWPEEKISSPFRIGLYGSNTQPLLAELSLMANSAKLRGRTIHVGHANTVKSLAQFDLVYVEQASSKTLNEIYDVLEGKPILLVTYEYANKQLVMINLTMENDRLRFEVNKSNIINHGLTPLPDLILSGGTEIDVAKLYREGQASLVALQKQLQGREKNLSDLSSAVQAQEKLNTQLAQQLSNLNKNIEKSDALIASQILQIQNQYQQIESGKKERIDLVNEVEQRGRELDEQQQQLNNIAAEISIREKRLAGLNSTIQLQEAEINNQRDAIAGLDEKVDAQQTTLMYMWGLVILGVLLIVTIFIAYAIKRRDNQRLAAHSQDIQFARDRLAIAKRKAEDASQAKSEFLSLMSHELRTPLQAIIGYTEVVIEELRLNDDQRHISDLTRVITNGERLLKLINGVLDLAKIESGRMELDLTEVKLSSLVDEAVGAVGPLLEKSAIRLHVQVDDGNSLPIADPEKLLHILINLLGNASKFSPNGEVTVKAIHEPHRIYMSVADTGIGLSPEQQTQIFEPFKQVDSGTTRKFQGSGLGLSITRQLCEMMGGSIDVESALGLGSTFIVDLPLPIILPSVPAELGMVKNLDMESMSGNPAAGGQHIVMIDDDPAFLDIMARTMRGEGYQVHTAGDAETGLRLLHSVKPEVITLDLLLPDENGWLLLEKIKSDPELREIPVIIISITDSRKNSHKHQAEEYLTKPIRRETLKLAIQRLATKE